MPYNSLPPHQQNNEVFLSMAVGLLVLTMVIFGVIVYANT